VPETAPPRAGSDRDPLLPAPDSTALLSRVLRRLRGGLPSRGAHAAERDTSTPGDPQDRTARTDQSLASGVPGAGDPAKEPGIEALAHELRTRMTTLQLAARVLRLKRKRGDAAIRDETLAALESDVDRLSQVVEDLLAVVHHHPGAAELPVGPLLVQRWLPGILAAESTTYPGLQVRALVAPDLPPVLADDRALGQVVRNLVANAARFGPDGVPVEVVAERDANAVILRVVDRGPGIDPSEAERLFEPFYRSPRIGGGGAGLGLAAVRQLLTGMGASIAARPRPGGGAEFAIRLAIVVDDEPS
jgi:two-component system, OmpR family, sensor histidine kinase KdpD